MDTKRTRSNLLSISVGVDADAGTIRKALNDNVAPHPKDEEYLYSWSYRLDEKAPPTAHVSIAKGMMEIMWTDQDEEAYATTHEAEITRRRAEDAAKEAAKAAEMNADLEAQATRNS